MENGGMSMKIVAANNNGCCKKFAVGFAGVTPD